MWRSTLDGVLDGEGEDDEFVVFPFRNCVLPQGTTQDLRVEMEGTLHVKLILSF